MLDLEPAPGFVAHGGGRGFLKMRGSITKNVYFCFGHFTS